VVNVSVGVIEAWRGADAATLESLLTETVATADPHHPHSDERLSDWQQTAGSRCVSQEAGDLPTA
jgi:hypothetical protein